ncbi:AAA family ATPase [Sphaerochaeta halotolerans]|uniref:AAA family ATPase n=1 Tax=Sphaerochaeta halotolerans TaxID=2293840 RepID=UPI00136F7BA5|nr:AAA family ATPase [Sphaerochaeta halotolerans]MXI87556.1 AAA family ATPase [Sphaerochaeta halotolerans]
MLVRFTVGNFLSFDTNQSLSLIADAHLGFGERVFTVDSVQLLKFGAIFGANAAGKSNVIKAMAFAHSMIKQGTAAIKNPEVYCRLKSENRSKPSYFEFEIALDDSLYAYGFEVIIAESVITEEWLVKLTKEKEQTLFARNTQKQTFVYDTLLFAVPVGPIWKHSRGRKIRS